MELSSELLSEYRGLLETIGKNDWPALKQKLAEDKTVIVLFRNYVTAWLERQKADEELDEFSGYGGPNTSKLVQSWAERTRLMNECRYALRDEKATYRELVVAVYGEENVYWEKETYEDSDDYDSDDDYEDC